MIGKPVIDPDNKTSCRKVITLGLAVIVNGYPVAPAVRPDAPTVFRRRGWGYRLFGGYIFSGSGAFNRRRSRREIGNEASRTSLDLVKTLIQLESLRIGS